MKYNNHNIENLLFDLGGVIIDLDRERSVRNFTQLGMTDADQMLGLYRQADVFLELEEGRISVDEFLAKLRAYFTRPVTDEQIDDAFSSFLLGIPTERLRALESLKEHFSLYVLSNTNALMFRELIPNMFTTLGHDMDYYFKGCIKSYEVHASKPEAKIFEITQQQLGITPENTLFFDDSQANVDAARALGWNAELVPPGTQFMDIVKKLWPELPLNY